jgi:hypothetical protein
MKILNCVASTSVPYWDGCRVFFEIVGDNGYIPCAISRMALEEISENRCFGKADFLACFASARERIEMLALAKLRVRAEGISGRLSLWADDVNPLPPGGAFVVTGLQRSRELSSPVSSKHVHARFAVSSDSADQAR